MRRLKRVAAVVFDCDSTLSAVEGVDELAAEHRAEVAALTDAAMRGELPLEAVYGRRLELIRPSRARIHRLAEQYVRELVPDAAAVADALRGEGIGVRIMSGGLLPAVVAAGAAIGVDDVDVAAVDVRFDEAGDFAGYDELSPLARSGGKREVLERWCRDIGGPVMMVGDGMTDLETKDSVAVFVAYAGVVARAPVLAAADVVIRSRSLAPVLPLATGGAPPRDGAARALFDRGLELLDDEYRARLSHLNA